MACTKQKRANCVRHAKHCGRMPDVRTEHCPFMETKTFCSACSVHCYAGEKQKQMKEVMRYAGPRMLCVHPYLTVKHGVVTLRNKRAKKKMEKGVKKQCFIKRLMKEFKENQKYVAGMVITQWVSLLCNVCLMLAVAGVIEGVFVRNREFYISVWCRFWSHCFLWS